MDAATLISCLNLLVLTTTGGVVAWYTWETRKLRQEAVRQTEIQVRPLLTLEWHQANWELWATNIGVGVARNIRCQPTWLSDEGEDPRIVIRWSQLDYLKAAGSRLLDSKSFLIYTDEPEEEYDAPGKPWMANFGHLSDKVFELTLIYANVVGDEYATAIRLAKGTPTMISDKRHAPID